MLNVTVDVFQFRNTIHQPGRDIQFDVMVTTQCGDNGFKRDHLMTWHELFTTLMLERREVKLTIR